MEYRVVKTATEIENDSEFSEGEMAYIEREARYGAEEAIGRAMARLRDIHYVAEKVREAESAQERSEGGGPFIQAGGLSPAEGRPLGGYSNRTAGEARPQAESPEAPNGYNWGFTNG